MRVIAIKRSETNPPKTAQTRGKIFSVKMLRCWSECMNRMETIPRWKHTRRLPHYGDMMEKKT